MLVLARQLDQVTVLVLTRPPCRATEIVRARQPWVVTELVLARLPGRVAELVFNVLTAWLSLALNLQGMATQVTMLEFLLSF